VRHLNELSEHVEKINLDAQLLEDANSFETVFSNLQFMQA
jgi:hypothetical protein